MLNYAEKKKERKKAYSLTLASKYDVVNATEV